MEIARRPRGRPAGSKDKKPRASRSTPKGGANPSSSGPTPSSSNVPSKAASTTPPVLPRSSLPPSVLATLEKPSVSNFARTHAIFASSEKVSRKKFLREVKEFARAKDISEDFVELCVGDARKLLDEKKTKGAEAPAPDVIQEEPEEPAQEKMAKKHKKKRIKKKEEDEPPASASAQGTAIRQEETEAHSTEHKKSKQRKGKAREAASPHPKPDVQADDDRTPKERKKKDKTREGAVNPALAETLAANKSKEPSTQSKISVEKKSKTPKHASTAPEQHPTETPIPLPTMTNTEPPKDPEDGLRKLTSTKKRKRDTSDVGGLKPDSGEAEVPDAPTGSRKKRHSMSSREPEPKSPKGKKSKKERKHKSQLAARSPSPPPRKKTKREHEDGETTHLTSKAQDSSHKTHEHADKSKDKKDNKAKSEKKHHAPADSQPCSSMPTALRRDAEQERYEQPSAHAQSGTLTPLTCKKKRKKGKREERRSDPPHTQPTQRSEASKVETTSKKPEAEPEVQGAKKKKSKKRKSIVPPEVSAVLPIERQASPAKPSSKFVPGIAGSGSAKNPPKRKRSPSPLSSPPRKKIPTDDGRGLSLASSTSAFSSLTLTPFANDTLVLPEPPQGLGGYAKKRWKKRMRKSLQQMLDEAMAESSSVADSTQQKSNTGAEMVVNPGGESDRSNKLAKKKAKTGQKVGDPSSENDAIPEGPVALGKEQGSSRKQATVPQRTVGRPSITATGSFAHKTPLPPIPSPQWPTSAKQAAAVCEAPASSIKPDLQGRDALPAQYVSGSDSEADARDAINFEPDTPVKSLQPLQQAGDGDADSESTESESESDAESETGSESEAEFPSPKKLPTPIPETASQFPTPYQRSFADTFAHPASLRPQPLLSMSQLKAATPTLPQTRGGVPLRSKTPPKANGNVDILGIAYGGDESDDESSGSSSDSNSSVDEKLKQAKTSDKKPATSHVPRSQPSKSLAEPSSHSQKRSVQAARNPSTASGSSLLKPRPKLDGADGDETACESSDRGSGDEEAAKKYDKILASPRTQIQPPQVAERVRRSPEKPLPKPDGGHNVTSKDKSRESEEEDGSTESGSDDDLDDESTTNDKELVPPPSNSYQQNKVQSPRSSPHAFKSPAKIPSRPLPQSDESDKANAGTEKLSEPAENEEQGLENGESNDSIDTTSNPSTVGASAEVLSDEDLGLPTSRDAPRYERAINTNGKRRPMTYREQVVLRSNEASKSPTANDIINGVALTGSRVASSAGDLPQGIEVSTAEPNAQETETNQPPAIDKGVQAESSPEASGESSLLPGHSNQEDDHSSNDGESDDPLPNSLLRPSSSHSKPTRYSPAAESIDDGGLNLGQNESPLARDGGRVKKEGKPSLRASPVPREMTTTNQDTPPSPRRLQNGQFGALSGQGRKSQPKPHRKSNIFLFRELGIDPDTVKRQESAEQVGENQNSSSDVNGLTIIDLDKSPQARLPDGRFAPLSNRKPNWARARAQDRLPSGRFDILSDEKPSSKRNRDRKHEPRFSRKSLLRELSIDPAAVKEGDLLKHQDEDSPRVTRGSAKKSCGNIKRAFGTQRPVEAPQTLTRVAYRENLDSDKNLDSDELVTETAVRKQLSAHKRIPGSSSEPLSSSRPSRTARSHPPKSKDDAQSFTPSPIRSTLLGVIIPSSEGGVMSASSHSVRDGKSAAEQHEDVVASTADAHRRNDVNPREPGTPSPPLHGAQDDVTFAVDGTDSEHGGTGQDDGVVESKPVHHQKDDGSVASGHESSPRPVFTISFSGTQDGIEEDYGSDKEDEVDEAEPNAIRGESAASETSKKADSSPLEADRDFDVTEPIRETAPAPEEQHLTLNTDEHAQSAALDIAMEKLPSPDKRDCVINGEGKPEPPFKTKIQNEAQQGQDERSSGDDEDQASEASSRGSAYSFDDDPKGFLNEDGTISGQATPRRRTGFQSNHFTPTRHPPGSASCLPFPLTTAAKFGLIQEQLSDEPLNLLIAVMLLNKTRGSVAIPKFWELMERYPTRDELVAANFTDLVALLKPLGLQSRRASQLISLCSHWVNHPPTKGQRYRVLNYPFKRAHKDIPAGEIIADSDPRLSAFEVCHLPAVGDYALDSWRIFCRDKLRGLADGYNGEGAGPNFEPEWKRVQPNDKELRAFLRWMWLREGWIWDPETGNKKRASEDEATANKLEKMRWDQEAGEEMQVPDSEKEDIEEAPDGLDFDAPGAAKRKGPNGDAVRDLQASPAKATSQPESFSSDGASSQLVREQRTCASQSQQSQAQCTPKATATVSSTAPAGLATLLRPYGRTTTTTTTSTSSSPVSAYRPQPTPLDLLGDNDDPDFNLAGLFRTPYGYRNKRSSSAQWATYGVVEETPPGSPRSNNQTYVDKDREQESDVENFNVFGGEKDGPGVGGEGHREEGHDEQNDEATGSAAIADRGRPSGLAQLQGEEEQEPEQQPSVDEQAEGGTASQESKRSCCVM